MNFWNSIKEQSAAALEVVSRDLQEFSTTVSTDTAAYLQGESSDNVQNEKGEVAEEDKSSSAEADDGSSSTSTSLMSLTSGLAAGLERPHLCPRGTAAPSVQATAEQLK